MERLVKEGSVEIPKVGTFSVHYNAPELETETKNLRISSPSNTVTFQFLGKQTNPQEMSTVNRSTHATVGKTEKR